MSLNFLDRKVVTSFVRVMNSHNDKDVIVFKQPKRYNEDIQNAVEEATDRFYLHLEINDENLMVSSADIGKAWDQFSALMNANLALAFSKVRGNPDTFTKMATGVVMRMNNMRYILEKENETTLAEFVFTSTMPLEDAQTILVSHRISL